MIYDSAPVSMYYKSPRVLTKYEVKKKLKMDGCKEVDAAESVLNSVFVLKEGLVMERQKRNKTMSERKRNKTKLKFSIPVCVYVENTVER